MDTHVSPPGPLVAEEPRDDHRTGILDLPTDVLNTIFDHFRDGSIRSNGRFQWPYYDRRGDADEAIRRRTIRNSRLVCRRFNDVASPLLCPVLRVHLDRESLDRANNISRSPYLAASVHGIQVVLEYRPRELATDVSRYMKTVKKKLEDMYRRCDFYEETWYLGGHSTDDETICPFPYRQYEKGMSSYGKICAAWSAAVNPKMDQAEDAAYEDRDEDNENDDIEAGGGEDRQGEDKDEEIVENHCAEYQQILLQGHEEYRTKHEEQFRLIADGFFVRGLATAISRMTNAAALGFIDSIRRRPDPRFDDPTLLLTSLDELRKIMSEPQDWATIEELDGTVELLPAKLLSELPIAIHQGGVRLREVSIGCFPIRKAHSMICPDRCDPGNPAWSDLRAACQSLSVFEFGSGNMNCKPMRYDYLPVEHQNAMDQYLSAMLSGQNLEVVRLNFYVFGINDGQSRNYGFHRVGRILETAVWPRISTLTIGSSAITQTELEKFCSGLGDCLSFLYWHSMELTSGTWAGALDILRDKVGTRCVEGRCQASAASLLGGEFGKPEPKDLLAPWDLKAWDIKPEPQVVVESLDYISGVKAENPLRRQEKKVVDAK